MGMGQNNIHHLPGGINIHRFFFSTRGFEWKNDPEPHHITSDSRLPRPAKTLAAKDFASAGEPETSGRHVFGIVGVCNLAIENDPFLVDFAISMVIFRGYVSLPEDMPIKAKILWPFRGFLY